MVLIKSVQQCFGGFCGGVVGQVLIAQRLELIGSGFGDMLTQAYDKKIPVVTFDSGLKAPEDITEGKNPIVAHVATSNKAAANINGEKLFEAIKADIDALQKAVYEISAKLYQQANPENGNGGCDCGGDCGNDCGNDGKDYYDADFTDKSGN